MNNANYTVKWKNRGKLILRKSFFIVLENSDYSSSSIDFQGMRSTGKSINCGNN